MKNLKRTLALILAVLVFAAVPALGATITVNKAIEGVTYNAYKIFDVVSSPDTTPTNFAYSIKSDNPWYNTVSTYAQTEGSGIILTKLSEESGVTTYNVSFDENYFKKDGEISTKAKAFADHLYANVPTKPESTDKIDPDATQTATAATAPSTDITVSLDVSSAGNGYYLITSSLGTLCILDTITKDETLTEKNTLPKIDKKIQTTTESDGATTTTDVTSTTASIGGTVTFVVYVYVEENAASEYVITDTMSDGLDLDTGSIEVCKGSEPSGSDPYNPSFDDTNKLTVETNYTLDTNSDDQTFKVTIKQDTLKDLKAGQAIRIKYTAKLNAAAAKVASTDQGAEADEETNKAKLSYGGTNKETETVKVYNYAFDLVKTDAQNVVLNGAKFKLYTQQSEGTPINLMPVKVGENIKFYRPLANGETAESEGVVTEIPAGTARIEGLAKGTYYLEESAVPEGYNGLEARQAVTINDKDLNATVTDNLYTTGGVQVKNQKGTPVPTTGGIGTTIFYILGAILLVGAGVILVTRKRMNSSAE